MKKQIKVVPYNPDWPKVFEQESSKIKEALGDMLVSIHHIGSTSVEGLASKPKIDILAVAKEPEKTIIPLETIDFLYKGEFNIPLHYGFSKRALIDSNLHLYQEGHPEIELNLLFRDYLRNNPLKKAAYAALKEALLQDPTSLERNNSPFTEYTLRKGDFIRTMLDEAGFSRLRILRCNDQTEWDAAKKLRDFYFFEKTPTPLVVPHHEHIVLYEGTRIIGYADIELVEKNASIRLLSITEAKRDQGFDLQLLCLIREWLKIKKYTLDIELL